MLRYMMAVLTTPVYASMTKPSLLPSLEEGGGMMSRYIMEL